jgi:cytochrome c biogenesis protein CcmG, thiol:disulfide interchange protein DsbE
MNLSKMTMTLFGSVAFLVSGFAAQTPQITLKSVDGRPFDLADREGRFVVMYFDGTWNPMVEKTLPALQQLSDQFSGQDVDFYWVSINTRTPGEKNYASDQDLRLFTKEMRVSVPVLRDPERIIFRALKLDAIPTIVLFDRDGDVYCKSVGFNIEQPDRFGSLSRILYVLLRK